MPPAFAQQAPTDDPVASAPMRFGAFGVAPRVKITNLGVDTNVFNTLSDPQRDFTFTISPGTDLWLRAGRGLVSVSGGVELVHFQKFETQRSLGSNATGQFEFRFNRLRPFASASTLNTKQRPGYEIDARVRHYESDFRSGAEFRVMSKTSASIEFRKHAYIFAGGAVFDNRPLNQELNRTLKAVDLSWRQRLTPLTNWITHVSRESERFEFADARNSDSFRLSSGFELGRFALIRGSAFVGYRKLRPADGGTVPEYSGITADVHVSYTAPTLTRLGAVIDRDVAYSYDVTTPYYIQTAWTATLTQRVIGRWDVQVSGGRDRLAYQTVAGFQNNARTDFIGRFGGGVGYAMGDQIRASFDVNSFYRSSDLNGREYGAVRAGVSVTYGY